jgi:hypothetical protein
MLGGSIEKVASCEFYAGHMIYEEMLAREQQLLEDELISTR